ncbi:MULTISPECIES: glycoside hydrolase family 43 protein [unclassified Mucilaginibacter]|uniref:glycoside hydrolase family 43 protein n=1 Tax=unclassified Mucilaginibacter TaxID=2617802 RepID=UPI002AC9887C|nr:MULTISPECIES: glycoside hydrolase family 43 protein [unclassified Mucilaginibacter]MEB0261570.1 glycoside hydrolase family 43 protein [Mucilaginibacter sp. 10I4]MEB0277178.1 glycoside hydrolase family 43 protein [Mucilaginibacter sp. 10B2]MEB0300826.1 glycoside hydrolase family 43 protein [Mucilaginibacter sp. 5C4]WPX25275.1 glycoside hydrolase family 43 protein [Mucilaginibacter sp. 5C4]
MNVVKNPILKGFNPDPSIIRAGEGYYIATSTFEWFPGVQIHHSTNLLNWELVSRPLNSISKLDMKGVPDSCGVWAPCLSYDNGTFYLVYSNVKSFAGVWKDTPNYLITTNDIKAEWSDSVFLNASGFDGSLFHDDDGKKWYVTMLLDHRKGKMFGGVILQEYSAATKTLVGPVHHIFKGSSLGLTEGPHLYKKDGYYYLLTAEGGTEYGHAATMTRSKNITGPYELGPNHPFISSREHKDYYLQKSGHADLVQTKAGNWLAVFLTSRPLSPLGLCILGRETSIETVNWEKDKWPILGSGSSIPRINVEIKEFTADGFTEIPFKDDFNSSYLNIHFQSLRIPITEDWASLNVRPGFLCLFGRESLSSIHEQSLLARRIQSLKMEAATCLNFSPTSFQQMAGLVCYYNTAHFHYLHISANDKGQRCLQIITHDHFEQVEAYEESLTLPENGAIYLKVVLNGAALQFYYALNEKEWIKAGPVLNAGILSDDYVREGGSRYRPAFTGSFVGICCQDLSGKKIPAYFDWFSYQEDEYEFPSSIKYSTKKEIV